MISLSRSSNVSLLVALVTLSACSASQDIGSDRSDSGNAPLDSGSASLDSDTPPVCTGICVGVDIPPGCTLVGKEGCVDGMYECPQVVCSDAGGTGGDAGCSSAGVVCNQPDIPSGCSLGNATCENGVYECPQVVCPDAGNAAACPATWMEAETLCGHACPQAGLDCDYPQQGDALLCRVADGGSPNWVCGF
jgi:hypothetical protein